MAANDLLSVGDAARELGLAPVTLRAAIGGHLTAVKGGRDWVLTGAEVERYRRESLGQSGDGPSK
jgi:hypothetical protein